jgi:selenoprotein W-related protein
MKVSNARLRYFGERSALCKMECGCYHRLMTEKPRITILYCTQCNWLLRAAWMAQELLQTFGQSLGEVALLPGSGGNFEIRVDGALVWERKRDGGFPGPKELKQRIRDIIEPERDLGHTDREST